MASSKGGDSDGSCTPSDGSDSEEHSERDSDYESDEEEKRYTGHWDFKVCVD